MITSDRRCRANLYRRTVLRNALHSAVSKLKVGVGFLVSRTPTSCLVMATSTQLAELPLWLLLRHRAEAMSNVCSPSQVSVAATDRMNSMESSGGSATLSIRCQASL
jgi:hypothetical protein